VVNKRLIESSVFSLLSLFIPIRDIFTTMSRPSFQFATPAILNIIRLFFRSFLPPSTSLFVQPLKLMFLSINFLLLGSCSLCVICVYILPRISPYTPLPLPLHLAGEGVVPILILFSIRNSQEISKVLLLILLVIINLLLLLLFVVCNVM